MADLIDRQQAIDEMRKLQRWNVVRGYNKNEGFLYDDVMYLLEKLPSAQQEQQMKCSGCRYDNHASGWSEHCVLCRRNYLDFKDRYER
jgi:hypothetical protein